MSKKYKYSKARRKKISEGTKKAMENPEVRDKIRLSKIGKPSHRKGKKQTEEAKRKMRDSSKGQVAWNKGLKGCSKQSEEHIEKRISQMRGSNNPAWKGGITPENLKIRMSIEFRLWREAVFARDNWTCQKYNNKGEKLNAHHIKNFSDYPELRFAIDNGITLSEKAHKEFHKRYGFKNNTEEQIKQFLIKG